MDLPGFGYAKVSKQISNAWATLIERYLKERTTLHLLALLVDVRRGPEEEEASLLDFLAEAGVPAMLIATKLDRLSKNKQGAALAKLKKETSVDIIGTSSQTRQGIDTLLSRLLTVCGFA